MGRVMKRWQLILFCATALVGILFFISCENDLLSFMFKNLFYENWKISSWSAPAPVVDGETHEQGEEYSNGFPMAMAMGVNGKIHLVAFKPDSSARDLIYSYLEPGDSRFEQSFEIVQDLSDNLGGIVTMPGIDLISDDLPIIT